MIPLLKLAIEAHGGLERWRQVHGIDLKLTIGGGLWELKGLPQGLVDVALHVEPAERLVTITPFGQEGAAGYFTADRVWIQKPRGDVVQERSAPRRCAPQKPRTTSGDTLFQLVFMMQTAQDVLNCDPTIARQSMSRVQLRKVLRRRRLRSSRT